MILPTGTRSGCTGTCQPRTSRILRQRPIDTVREVQWNASSKEADLATDNSLFSMVVPVLNEEDVIQHTYAKLNSVLTAIGMPFEVVVVDNGSTDRTPALVADICAQDPRWKYVRLSRNFGYQNSITAGMLAAMGD